MKESEFPTTRVDWRLRAQALLLEIKWKPDYAEDFIVAALEAVYEVGGGGVCPEEHCSFDGACCVEEHVDP